MQKRLLLAFVLSFLVLHVWGQLFAPKHPSPKTAPSPSLAASPLPSLAAKPQTEPPPAPQKAVSAKEQLEVLETEKLKVKFSNIGGTIHAVELKPYQEELPATDIVVIPALRGSAFRVIQKTDDSISYKYQDEHYDIEKRYQLLPEDYLINVSVSVGPKKMSNQENIMDAFSLDISRLDNKLKRSRDLSLFEYAASLNNSIIRKGNIVKYSNKTTSFIFSKDFGENEKGKVRWVGYRNRYFTLLVSPQFETAGMKTITDKSLLTMKIISDEPGPGKLEKFDFKVYCGPQNLNLLREHGNNFADMMKFSNWGLLDAVAKAIYAVLNIVHKVIPNWGVCIIILGVLIYSLTYPLTLKSMASMKKMQALQPKIAKLKEQHKNNPQKLSKEQMELFKEHKINPMGGCFPVLLQMPIFIGFYQVLWRSVMLKGADFLWIKDLSEPDRIFVFSSEIPIIGNELNLLPFLMGAVMFLQQKVTAKNMAVSDPAQASQQKMMTMFLPVMMIFIFYHAPSGLTLYFTFFYLLTTFTQWRMSKTR